MSIARRTLPSRLDERIVTTPGATSETVRQLFTALVDECEVVAVDLSETEFIDSSFLQNLAAADRLARGKGGHVRLQLGTKDVVKRALEISGLLSRLECTSDRAEARRRA